MTKRSISCELPCCIFRRAWHSIGHFANLFVKCWGALVMQQWIATDPGLASQSPGHPQSLGSVDWLRSLGKHAALQWASPEQGVGNDLEQRENQASTLIMHSVLVKWNSLSLLSLEMLQCTSYLLFHIPRDTSILTVTCKMFKNKGCNVVSGERKMIFLSLIRTVLGLYVIYMKIWPKGPERMPPSPTISW